MKVTPVTEDGTEGESGFDSSVTKDGVPDKPQNFGVTYAGSDFIDLEWEEAETRSQCVLGVATFCQQTNKSESGPGCGPGIRAGARLGSGRVNHLSACTRYECWAAYPASEVHITCII